MKFGFYLEGWEGNVDRLLGLMSRIKEFAYKDIKMILKLECGD